MKFLIDTHVWLWWLLAPERLAPGALAAIEDGDNQPLLSVASSWEIAVKYAIGKLELPEPPEEFVVKRLRRDGIGTLHVEHRHALHVATLPFHHRDPFDRLLIAQARIESIPVVTADPEFKAYPVEIVWD
jgi:PIN domain nuclease of toxin-antitoxin system